MDMCSAHMHRAARGQRCARDREPDGARHVGEDWRCRVVRYSSAIDPDVIRARSSEARVHELLEVVERHRYEYLQARARRGCEDEGVKTRVCRRGCEDEGVKTRV